ncbi:MAG: hypothetical protein AAB354_01275 [candidate division KSB1 bacterium]|mgnify:CR=1 FL=1
MKSTLLLAIALASFAGEQLHAQNSDMLVRTTLGKYRGMASAGLALANEASALAANPAGLTYARGVTLALSADAAIHSYSLLRRNSNGTAFDLNAQKTSAYFDDAAIALAFGSRFGFGLGYFRKLTPYLDNDRRAITGSVLFHQTTSGSIHALSLASGFKLSERIRLGAALDYNSGTITSAIRGDNHGRETYKWARLENDFSGLSFQASALLHTARLRVALRAATPSKLKVQTRTAISEDRDYAVYFPAYQQLDFALPTSIGLGVAFTGNARWTWAADFETQRFQASPLQVHLYEFGGAPNWKNANVFRLGLEWLPFKNANLPLRFGYAHLPQLYASNQAGGEHNNLVRYVDTKQNRRHLLALGTSLALRELIWSFGVEYSFLKWHRELQLANSVLDDFREVQYAIFSTLEYRLH